MSKARQVIDKTGLTILAFILGGIVSFAGWLGIGLATGVIAMCGSAPQWWSDLWFKLMYWVPAIGGALGIVVLWAAILPSNAQSNVSSDL